MRSPQYILCCAITIGAIAVVTCFLVIDYAAKRLEAAEHSLSQAVPASVASGSGISDIRTMAETAPLVTEYTLGYIWSMESSCGNAPLRRGNTDNLLRE